MISYIEQYNDLVEKECIRKNKKNKEKQRNNLLNPNLKFSSSLNAFVPPPDSPKINKTDFVNIVKSKYESLGKEPPSDVQIENAFFEFNDTGIISDEEIFGIINALEFSDQLMQSPLRVGTDVRAGVDASSPPLLDLTDFVSTPPPAASPPLFPTPPTFSKPNLAFESPLQSRIIKTTPAKVLSAKEAQKKGILLTDRPRPLSEQFQERIKSAKEEALKAMGFSTDKGYFQSRMTLRSDTEKGNTSKDDAERSA